MTTLRKILNHLGHDIKAGCCYVHHLEIGIFHFNRLPYDVRQQIIYDCGQVLTEAGINFIEETGELIEMEAETLKSLLEDIAAIEKLGAEIETAAIHPELHI